MPSIQKSSSIKKQKQPQVEQDSSSIVYDAYLRVLRPYAEDAKRIANQAFDAGFNSGELTVRMWSTIIDDEFKENEYDASEKIGDDRTEEVYSEVLKQLAKETRILWVQGTRYWRWG